MEDCYVLEWYFILRWILSDQSWAPSRSMQAKSQSSRVEAWYQVSLFCTSSIDVINGLIESNLGSKWRERVNEKIPNERSFKSLITSSLSHVVALTFPVYLMLWEFKPFQTDCSPVKPRIRQSWKLSRTPILPGHSLLPFS